MKDSHFVIVHRFNDRYAWLFVVGEGRRRRVLARSTRDFRSRAKAKKAINKMRGAPVAPRDPRRKPFPLPTTSFQIVPGVVPLIVEDAPEFEDAVEASPRAAAVAVAKPAKRPKKRAAARKPKPRRRRTT